MAIAANPISTNQGFKSIVPYIADCSRFIATAMKAFAPEIDAKAPGTTFKEVSGKIVAAIAFARPPLAEQRRVVAKVDELMALCDRLEAARAEREAIRDRLAAASLARLNAPDPITFQDDARFALDTLRALTTRPDQIKHLRQTIFNLAVRGYLSTGGTWRSSPIKLGDVATLQNGCAFKSEWFAKSGTRLLRNANVGHGMLNWDQEVRLPKSRIEEFERFRLTEGDVILSLDRPFIVTGTKVARVKAKDLPALLLQRVGRFILSQALNPDYVFLWIDSPHFSEQIDPGRSTGVPHISSKQVEAAVLFLPALAEEHRIDAKVDALMALCDRLEASLDHAVATCSTPSSPRRLRRLRSANWRRRNNGRREGFG
jgi:type I restriction enzyme S subunit